MTGARTVDAALAAAGLDWTIEEHSADSFSILDDSGITNTGMTGYRFFLRSDTKAALHLGGGRYTAVTNADAFAPAEPAVAMGAQFRSAGELKGGRSTYLELDLPGSGLQIGAHDILTCHLLLRTAHDGSGRVTGSTELRRLVCTNGMTANIGIPTTFAIGHTRSAHDRLAAATTMMQGAARYAREFYAVASHLLDTPMGKTEYREFIDGLYPEPSVDNKRAYGIWERRRDELMQLFTLAETNDYGRGSRWGAYSAITEYLDWHSAVRGGGRGADARAVRQLDAMAQGTKDRAMRALSV